MICKVKFNNAGLALLLLSLTACSTLTEQKSASIVNVETNPIQRCGDPLRYQNIISRMTPDERQMELNKLDAELETTDSYCPILHLAMMLSTPVPDIQNDRKSVKLFEKVQSMRDVTPDDMEFTEVSLNHLRQRQGLRNRIGAFAKELQLNKKYNTILEQKITVLQSQIEQLKSLEVEMGKKEQSVIVPVAE